MKKLTPVTKEELQTVCIKLGNNKPPGQDGIPNIELKHTLQAPLKIFVDLYKSCLEERIFSTNWKKQRLVLLSKGENLPKHPSS